VPCTRYRARMPQADAHDTPPRNANFEARRRTIIDTSARLFATKGYHATGIVELCDANSLGKGALYHYIGSKEALLAAIHDRVMDEVMQGADRVATAGGAPSAQLAMLGSELLDVIHRYPDHVWVFLHEFPALTGDRASQFRERRQEYEQRVEAVLRAGIRSGEFRKVDPWLTARAWLGMHNYTYLWLKPGHRFGAKDVADPFAEIFLRGIEGAAGPPEAKQDGRHRRRGAAPGRHGAE
jgi:AcrR family transcriptional regulator